MLATLRCSFAAASRTASLTAGWMRRFSVDILVFAMRYNITHKYSKCNALFVCIARIVESSAQRQRQ